MKKIGIGIVGMITIIMLITACISSGGTTKVSGADELDAAIREASDYLNTKIPNGNKVAFINISGGFPDLANYIIDDLSKHGVNDGVFSVVDRAQLDAVRAELNFNMSGEVSDSSAQEIGKMLGAQTIVSGSVQRVGALYRLTVKAIEVQTAAVQGQWNRNIPNGATIAALTGNTSGGTSSTSGGTTSGGQTAQAAEIKNGTYYFFPRLRAIQTGRDVNAYLDRIVVRSGYFNFVVLGTPTGGENTSPEGDNQWYLDEEHFLLQNLDNQRLSYNAVNVSYEEPRTISFQNIRGSRFSFTFTGRGELPIIFEEIDLSKAEYEP